MARGHDASAYVPVSRSLPTLRSAARTCQGCDLYKPATQTVFGSGPRQAKLVFVGEQPGNEEDLEGLPFVGPAGRLLDRALLEAGIDRAEVYVTNVVKHFKFEERGKRRIHKRPNNGEVEACSPWLEAEVASIQPKIIVCLGATAAQALLGRAFRLTKERGRFIAHEWGPSVTAMMHPSAILRAPDEIKRHEQYQELVADLKAVKSRFRSL